MSYTTIIDEDHLATFTSPAEANIHRQANIAKIKLGLVKHYLDYHFWIKEQYQKNLDAQTENGFTPIVNFEEVYHRDFESWLEATRLENGKVITENRKAIVSYHPDWGYIGEDVAQAMASGPDLMAGNIPEMPNSLKQHFEKRIED